MERIIRYEDLRRYAYSNDRLCTGTIRGIVISFFGLGGQTMYDRDTLEGEYYAAENVIYLVPYNNPWAWMNRQAVEYTDELVDVLLQHYGLPDSLPVVSTGGSMGGMSALVYTRYAGRTPVACVANCPVCDLPFHFTERPDLPRTLYSAFANEPGTMQQALEAHSPLHLAQDMPDVDYVLFHCTADEAVNKEKHSDRFVAAMRACGRRITYYEVPDRGHCDLPLEMKQRYVKMPLELLK